MSEYDDTVEQWLAGSEFRHLVQGVVSAKLKFSGKAEELFHYAQEQHDSMFLPRCTKKILDGKKIQARQLAQKGDTFSCTEENWGVWQENGYCKCYIGQLLSLWPIDGKRQRGHTIVTNIHLERLGNISEADAHAEGYASVQEYIDTWRKIYGEWIPNQEVWVVGFEYVGDDE